MREAEERMIFQNAVDRCLSGLQENPFLAQRIMNQERTGEPVVKKRLSIGLVLAIILMMITVTALAVALLSPKEIVEQVAVPMAQENDHDDQFIEIVKCQKSDDPAGYDLCFQPASSFADQ